MRVIPFNKLWESVNRRISGNAPDAQIDVDRDMTGAFSVEDTHSLWLAVHQVINELEKEIIVTARNCSANPSLSNYHLGASEGVAMLRRRLIEKRNTALNQIHAGKIHNAIR